MYITIYKIKIKYRYLNTSGRFMHVYGVSPAPPRWMWSIQDTKWQKPHWKYQTGLLAAAEQVLPSPGKTGVTHISEGASRRRQGVPGAVSVSEPAAEAAAASAAGRVRAACGALPTAAASFIALCFYTPGFRWSHPLQCPFLLFFGKRISKNRLLVWFRGFGFVLFAALWGSLRSCF